jgi:Trk-type K+ transport system membrane component
MGTALSLLVVMTVLLFVVRVAAVALRLTGLVESAARFQALSAISGAGFTTRESESIVNYPVRRQKKMTMEGI